MNETTEIENSRSLEMVLPDSSGGQQKKQAKYRVVCGLHAILSQQSAQEQLARQCQEKDAYIQQLEALLREHNIELPKKELTSFSNALKQKGHILKDSSIEEIRALLDHHRALCRNMNVVIEFRNLSMYTYAANKHSITTVSSVLTSLFCGVFTSLLYPQEKHRVDILKDLNGRILPRKMTLLLGPPGAGRSVFMQALNGRLQPQNAKLEGSIYYDGDDIHSGKFIPGKVSDYVEQGDTHTAVLTVEETLKFAWLATTGGHHSYARAKDDNAAAILNQDDASFSHVNNLIIGLGLKGCKDVYIGDGMIRGISGGQKRRVTIGEMMACPRVVKFMDSVSNGLDAATTYDIVAAAREINITIGTTLLVSLLQPPPEVYRLFDEIILLSEGQIIYQGARDQIMTYFERLGYSCPKNTDEADFLQELPTPEGKRFLTTDIHRKHNTEALARAWKQSEQYHAMLGEMKSPDPENDGKDKDIESFGVKYSQTVTTHSSADTRDNTADWPKDVLEKYPESFWFYFKLCLDRQLKMIVRNPAYIMARIGRSLLVGGITGSLFSNIKVTDVTTTTGFMFNTILFVALGSFAILPSIYDQKAVFYKQSDSLFFPTSAYTCAQALALFPLEIAETIAYITIVYWSAGLSKEYNGSRFLTFIVVTLAFSTCIGQMFRMVSAYVPTMRGALPATGVIVVIMVLFSGFIQPKSLISDGWIWFYWMNPVSWAIKSVTINEYKSSKYDFLTCINMYCTETKRFGDFILEQYGNPTDEKYIWYSFAVLIAEYTLFFFVTYIGLKYLRMLPSPPPPVRNNDVDEDDKQPVEDGLKDAELPFDPVSFAFKDIWYTVTLPSGEDVDLLKAVDGYFEAGTVTALMGSSGAGKTTLLDVLAGRKSTGVIRGDMYVNGAPKVESYFRKIMGYVEQFDSLPPKSTAREAIAFSAALRLPSNISDTQREHWVDAVLHMLDLHSIENDLIGVMDQGGMTFEQRKRVSIGVELAANPSILFLDEPTTGLDSRAAQSLVKNIRRIAASGRSVVCTIHQPSTSIFNAFDSLLLLRRGGQTVYFGNLGDNCSNLISYFESAPGVNPIPDNVNPATWMLEVIGAGTSQFATNDTDFYSYYLTSSLCELNTVRLEKFTQINEGSKRLDEKDTIDNGEYNTSYMTQFRWLMHRIATVYWRTPEYSIVRVVVNIFIALIFGSAFPLQEYSNDVATSSRSAVIYVTSLFCGILAMINIIPTASAERPVFYREQQSRMYTVWIYAFTTFIIEVPYILIASLAFTLPFFYIVGFNNVGNINQKFFWYWLFNALLQGTMLFLGQFFVALTPDEATTQVLGGLVNTVLGLFCGFLIREQSYPTFWLFMYWLDPLHYALEGLVTTQFHGDTTPITLMNGQVTTAEEYMKSSQFTTWSIDHAGFDVLALCIFIGLSLLGNYLSLAFIRHNKR